MAGAADWKDYEFSLNISAGDDDGIGAIVRYQDRDNYYRVILLKDPNNKGPFRRLEKFVDGKRYVLAESQDAYNSGQVYNLVMKAVGDKLEVYLDGAIILEATDNAFKRGKIGVLSYAVTDLHVDNVKVAKINP